MADEPDVRDPETYAIIRAAMEVDRELGCGFLEAVYHDAMEVEMQVRGIPYLREVWLPVLYKGRELASKYKANFLCFENVVVELKAIRELSGVDRSQLMNYLKATKLRRGLLINFGTTWLKYERFVH